MRKTLLLVFIHGFKGSDNTFANFPKDLQAHVSSAIPDLDVLSVQYPSYETRGDLRECVARFKEWLQNKVIDLEVSNRTPSPTVDPSVRVILVGHSMGGIVAAETLLSIARDEPVRPGAGNDTTEAAASRPQTPRPKNESRARDKEDRATSAPPEGHNSALFFPYVQAVLTFDTPFLGISPGVLAHGAEEHFNHASAAYKAYNGASEFFGWSSPKPAQPIANASSRGLPAPGAPASSGWGKWGKYAMVGGAAAAVAGAAGAAYMNWNQINQGLAWAGSHLEFVGCLARGAELQKRVESVVKLTETHGVGFADFYTVLGEKVSSKTQYAGAVLGQDRTFCVVPKDAQSAKGSPTGSKRSAPSSGAAQSPPKRRKTLSEEDLRAEMKDGEKVQEFARDTSKKKGDWVKCRNDVAPDELKAHTSMFAPGKNPGYYNMLPEARDRIVGWIDKSWIKDGEEDGGDEIHEDEDEEAVDDAEEGGEAETTT